MPLVNVDLEVRSVLAATDPLAVGVADICEVPPKEYWRPYNFYAQRVAGATLTISKLYLYDPKTGAGQIIREPTAAASQLYDFRLDDLVFPPGWQVKAYIAAYNAGDTFKVDLIGTIYKVES